MTLSASFQSRDDAVGIDGNLFTGDFHGRAGGVAEATQDHRNERTVHRLTHDVGQDCTRGTDQRTDDDQEIVAEC